MHETAPRDAHRRDQTSPLYPGAKVDAPHIQCCVFVYGTLRRGEVNDINRLRPAPRLLGHATLRGVLYDLGAYPGLQLSSSKAGDRRPPPFTDVAGEVYAIDAALEAVLDEIEEVFPQQSGEYLKRRCHVLLNGQSHQVLLYEIAPDRVEGRVVIEGGDWVAYRKRRDGHLTA